MKNLFRLVTALILIIPFNFSQIKNFQSENIHADFTSSNLPIVVINTNGQEIPYEYKITADMGIIYNGEGVRNYITDPFNHYNGKIGIELRGSSSQQFPKKQYGVETKDSLGMIFHFHYWDYLRKLIGFSLLLIMINHLSVMRYPTDFPGR